jgi:hypothetical protein
MGSFDDPTSPAMYPATAEKRAAARSIITAMKREMTKPSTTIR